MPTAPVPRVTYRRCPGIKPAPIHCCSRCSPMRTVVLNSPTAKTCATPRRRPAAMRGWWRSAPGFRPMASVTCRTSPCSHRCGMPGTSSAVPSCTASPRAIRPPAITAIPTTSRTRRSAAPPQRRPYMAGVMALVMQKTGTKQGLANLTLYKLAARDNLTSRKCSAGSGYDRATGLGSVNVTNLVNE